MTKVTMKRWRNVLIGGLAAMAIAALVIVLLFFLPVSLPIIGRAIASIALLSAAIGVPASIFASVGVVLVAGILGSLLAKGVELLKSGVGKMFRVVWDWAEKIAETYNSAKEVFSSKNDQPSVRAFELSDESVIDKVSNKPIVDAGCSVPANGNFIDILDQIGRVNLHEAGWANKLVEIRNKQVSGSEENILMQLSLFRNYFTNYVLAKPEYLELDKGKKALSELEKKLHIIFHPDRLNNTSGDLQNLAKQDQIKELVSTVFGWCSEANEEFRIRTLELSLRQKYYTEEVEMIQDYIRNADEFIAKSAIELKCLENIVHAMKLAQAQQREDRKAMFVELQKVGFMMDNQPRLAPVVLPIQYLPRYNLFQDRLLIEAKKEKEALEPGHDFVR